MPPMKATKDKIKTGKLAKLAVASATVSAKKRKNLRANRGKGSRPRSKRQSKKRERSVSADWGRDSQETESRSPIRRKRNHPSSYNAEEEEEDEEVDEEESLDGVPRMPLYLDYKYGATNEYWADQPRALLLFSGRSSDGDLASYLSSQGWVVVVADKVGPTAVDLLDDKIHAESHPNRHQERDV